MVDKAKGDKIKAAIAKSKKTNFEKAFDSSPLSKYPSNSTSAPRTGKSSASYEVGGKPSGGTSSENGSSGSGSSYRDDLDYVAGVASRAAKESASLRSAGEQRQQNFQTSMIRTARENYVNDRNTDASRVLSEQATNRSNAVLDQSNANAQLRASSKPSESQMLYQQGRDANNDAKDAARQALSEQELASRAGQTAASLRSQRNNQLLSLARGGL